MYKTLLVMAAGYGSRYGGFKQLETFGSKKLTIAEYNILNALKFGFSHFVFVVQPSMLNVFHDRLSTILPKNCSLDFVIQTMPEDFCDRKKPLGTGYAVLCAENFIKYSFGVINADDFYGEDAIAKLAQSLTGCSCAKNIFYNIGFELNNTLSCNGSVSRGVMNVDKRNNLISIEEIPDIVCQNNILFSNKDNIKLNKSTIVSMNLWGFSVKIFKLLSIKYNEFKNKIVNKQIDEFYLPTAVGDCMHEGLCEVEVIKTTSKWCGVTYSSDREQLNQFLNNLK